MGEGPTIVVERCTTTETSALGRFRVGGTVSLVRFDGVAPEPSTAADAFGSIACLMGMENDQTVVSVPRLTRGFRRRMADFERVHLALFPQHHEAPIRSLVRSGRRDDPGEARRTAAFFSGGVDSFHLLVEHGDDIDDLLFVRGFDVDVDDGQRSAEVLDIVARGAQAAGKPLLVIDTDLRQFSDPTCDWTWFCYAGLFATSMLLGRTHRQVRCAVSVADRHLPDEAVRLRGMPFGNDRTEVLLSSRTATRTDKIAAVASAGLARDTLRVCWQNVPGTINCGACPKCTRTLLELASVGQLGAISTLPSSLDGVVPERLAVASRSDRAYLTEVLEAAEANGVLQVVDLVGPLLDAAAKAS